MKTPNIISLSTLGIFLSACSIAQPNISKQERFQQLENEQWISVFHDSCAEDWNSKWTIDGNQATITHSEKGMDFLAGPERMEDSSHAVLWTKQSFEGDIRIDYEYTKIDDAHEAVTILYIQATGSGIDGYLEDIAAWSSKREIPSMSQYFLHMNLYHISYAAFALGNTDPNNDYIRARRYLPETGRALENTDLTPDYKQTGLFQKDVPHKITVIKKGDDLFMRIRNAEEEKVCHWKTNSHPAIEKGRIGLRHMWTRGARYKNFTVSKLK